jgi:hypothetical protein
MECSTAAKRPVTAGRRSFVFDWTRIEPAGEEFPVGPDVIWSGHNRDYRDRGHCSRGLRAGSPCRRTERPRSGADALLGGRLP